MSKTSFSLSLSYTNALGLFSRLDSAKGFAKGSVYGQLLSPSINGQSGKPLAGVKLTLGGETSTTDEQGQFLFNKVPANTTVPLKVDSSTLDPSFIPRFEEFPISLKPADILELNPELLTSVGFDGNVFSNQFLPPNTKLVIQQENYPYIRQVVELEDDGYFATDGIPSGTYKLSLSGVKNPPKPMIINIKPEDEWLYDLEIRWYQ